MKEVKEQTFNNLNSKHALIGEVRKHIVIEKYVDSFRAGIINGIKRFGVRQIECVREFFDERADGRRAQHHSPPGRCARWFILHCEIEECSATTFVQHVV